MNRTNGGTIAVTETQLCPFNSGKAAVELRMASVIGELRFFRQTNGSGTYEHI